MTEIPGDAVYCTRCHMTEPLHHKPNISPALKPDSRGLRLEPCDAFTPPADK